MKLTEDVFHESGKAPLSEESYRKICDAAQSASRNAYAPYSGFRVGAAVLVDGGELYVGGNIENASFGATVCAERIAMGSAFASKSDPSIQAIAIYAESDGPDFSPAKVVPCGICLQWLGELAPNAEIIICERAGRSTYSVDQLLTAPFVSGRSSSRLGPKKRDDR